MSMLRFRIFASVNVLHDYFADGHARYLQFLPQRETTAFMRRFDISMRADERSMQLYVCETQLPGMWSERLDGDDIRTLKFDIRSSDPASLCYTENVLPPSPKQDAEVRSAPVLAATDASNSAFLPPLATIALPVDPSESTDMSAWCDALGTTYRLRLGSRSTIWKYLLMGDWNGRQLSIVDQRGNVTFTQPATERLSDGHEALVLRSTSPILLQERPSQRFQLCDASESPERVLIPRLPGAKPQRLWRERLGGETTAVSEIFVHH